MPAPEYSALQQALTPRLTRYIPHAPEPPQTAFLLLDILEEFYGGAAGGGKSDALLMAALQYVDVPGYSALLLRRTFPELSQPGAIMARSHEWLAPWRKHGVAWNEQKKRWTFPGGATLSFGYLRAIRDVYQYQGAEYQFIGFDELTQFPEEPYTYLFSRLRRPDSGPLSEVPLRMRSASNPGNIGHGWVKKRFVAPAAREAGRVFIPAKLDDNPHLDQREYKQSLSHLSEVLQRQLLDGDWGAFEGAAFHKFDPLVHLVPRFELPAAWERFESVDIGINNPTAWLAWAVDHEGNHLIFDSVYTDEGDGLPSNVAPRLLARRQVWQSTIAHADPSAWNRTGGLNRWGLPASIATEYEDNAVTLTPANNDPRAGYTRLRELLEPDEARLFPDWHPRARQPGSPRLFIVGETCPEVVEQFAAAPLQPIEKRLAGEIIDPDWEGAYGHGVASARYGGMSRPDASVLPPGPPPEPRTVAAVEEGKRSLGPDRSRYQF